MSPTLLEATVAIVLIVAAWQLGIAIAPDVVRLVRSLRHDVDDVTQHIDEEASEGKEQ